VLAAWSPFALLRLIPMMEGAAASVVGQRTAMSAAAGSAGVHSPAAYMRQAMDRSARPSSPRAYPTTGGTTYAHARATERTNSEPPPGESGTGARSGPPSNSGGGTVDPTTRRPSAPPTSYAQPRSSTTEAPPTSPVPSPPPPAERPRPPEPPPPPPARRPRPPEPPPDRGPPLDRGDA
jgi:hypothetical protein